MAKDGKPPRWMASVDGRRAPERRRLFAPISVGELFDKIAILEIKAERIGEPAKRRNVAAELRLLLSVRDRQVPRNPELEPLATELKQINETLWNVEGHIRECERLGEFGERFIALARSVYRTNDRRAELKRRINVVAGSTIFEEKSYTEY